MTQPMPNTSSTGSSGCSQVDKFSEHFEKCCNREGHVKASVFPPTSEGVGLYQQSLGCYRYTHTRNDPPKHCTCKTKHHFPAEQPDTTLCSFQLNCKLLKVECVLMYMLMLISQVKVCDCISAPWVATSKTEKGS